MGRKVTLTENEKATIIQELHRKQTTLQVAKTLNRGHRTVKKTQLNSFNGRSDKGTSRSSIASPRKVKRMKREIRRNPFQTSNEIFRAVGLPNTPKSTRCHILKSISK